MFLQCIRSNPFRVADWRWQRAVGYLSGQQPPPSKRRDGPVGYRWIREAIRFKRELDACQTDWQRFDLAERRPAIFWAHYAYADVSGPPRWVMEARLLARNDDFEVGIKGGMGPQIVEAYEALFFNVREKLQHRDYILNVIMRHAVARGVSEREYDLLLKLYAYFYGPHFLEALASRYFVNPLWCGTADGVGGSVEDDAITSLKLKAAVAAKTVQVNSHTQMNLLDTFTKFVEIERNTDSADRAQNQILDHINVMLTSLPFSVGGRDPQSHAKLPPGPTTSFDTAGVELNFTELLQVSVGRKLPDEPVLTALHFPDPPHASPAPTGGTNG